MTSGYDGLVIAGGRSRRMGGADKTLLAVGGQPMRSAALAALSYARQTIVVGPTGDLVEDPPGSGPLSAVAAGLRRVEAPVVVIVAADLPFVTVETVETLAAQANAIAVDDEGKAQYLLVALRTEDLRRALPANPAGRSMRSVIDALEPTMVTLGNTPPPWWDCDTPEDLAQARLWAKPG